MECYGLLRKAKPGLRVIVVEVRRLSRFHRRSELPRESFLRDRAPRLLKKPQDAVASERAQDAIEVAIR
jgi:hypothetical protein